MTEIHDRVLPFPRTEETQLKPESVLKKSYESVVVIPYSSNLFERGSKKGTSHLSLFSALATVAAAELYKAGSIDNILLCGESTFGIYQKSTMELMVRKLLELGIPMESIRVADAKKLNNTAFQIEALAARQKKYGVQKPYLLVDWKFHDKRVRTHAQAYGLNADTVSVEDTLSHFFPNFNVGKYRDVLEAFVKREQAPLRILSVDSKGRIPKLIAKVRGASVNDVVVVLDGAGNRTLKLLDTTGKNRMQEVNS